MVLDAVRRRLRVRRTRRLRDRARSHPPDRLAGEVDTLLSTVATDDGPARFTAVEALAAIARSRQDHPTRDRATDALVGLLADGDAGVRTAVSPEARYVALQRPSVVPRLDDPYAAVLGDDDPDALRRASIDVGLLVAERESAADLDGAVAALRHNLVGGDPGTRRAAATAYVLMADAPGSADDPGTVAEHLAILAGGLDADESIPPKEWGLDPLTGGRTLRDAVGIYRDVAET